MLSRGIPHEPGLISRLFLAGEHMRSVGFNYGTLKLLPDEIHWEIPLRNVLARTPEELEPVFEHPDIHFPVTIVFSEETESFIYKVQLDPKFIPFENMRRKKTGLIVKLNATENLAKIGEFFEGHDQLVTVFKPVNFFVDPDGGVKVFYCGVKGLLPAEGYEEESLFEQVKRLILLIYCRAGFDELKEYGCRYAIRKTPRKYQWLVRQLIKAKTYRDLYFIVRSEIEELVEQEDLKRQRRLYSAIVQGSKWVKTAWLLAAISLAIAGGAVYQKMTVPPARSAKEVKENERQRKPAALTRGLHYASMKQYEKAAREFAQLDFDQLGPDEKKEVLYTYMYAGQAEKAIDLMPDFAEVVVAYYLSSHNMEGIRRLKSDEPPVRFEQAVLTKDFDAILQLRNQVKLDPRRQKIIVDAYIQKKDYKAANTFARSTGDADLLHYSLIKTNEAISR